MFCSKCGNSVDPSSRFCPSCGATVYAATSTTSGSYPPPPPFAANRLTRPRENRMIAGVCAAFAQHYGWDPTVVRILTALFVILTGVGAIAYLVAWVVIPEAPYILPAKVL